MGPGRQTAGKEGVHRTHEAGERLSHSSWKGDYTALTRSHSHTAPLIHIESHTHTLPMYSHTRVHILSHSDKSHTYTYLHTAHTHTISTLLAYSRASVHTHIHTLTCTHLTLIYSLILNCTPMCVQHIHAHNTRYTYTRTLAPTLPCTLHVLPYTFTQSMCTHMYSHSYLHTQVMCLYSHTLTYSCAHSSTPADPAA